MKIPKAPPWSVIFALGGGYNTFIGELRTAAVLMVISVTLLILEERHG